MAVRRLKGLYLKSEGKYLEDYPSCYVEQTEALFEWRTTTQKLLNIFKYWCGASLSLYCGVFVFFQQFCNILLSCI